MNAYTELKTKKGLTIVRFDNPIYGGLYGIVCKKQKKAKLGLTLQAAFDLFAELTIN